MITIYLHTGTNIGDRAANLSYARQLVTERIGSILKASSIYETEAWGLEEQADFYNQALEVTTDLSPEKLLQQTKQIEQDMGRQKEIRWGKRLIDVDILFYGQEVIHTEKLKIPHAEMANRNFVLIPMLELQPELEHPILKKTIEEIYWESKDTLDVVMLSNDESNA